MEDIIKNFLSELLMITFDQDIDENSDLFQMGFMDSHSYIQLIRFLEMTFDIKFEDEELLSSVTTSVSGIVSLIGEKLFSLKE